MVPGPRSVYTPGGLGHGLRILQAHCGACPAQRFDMSRNTTVTVSKTPVAAGADTWAVVCACQGVQRSALLLP